jgi:hypothetical protein
MQAETAETVAIRAEIMDLLRQQLAALDSTGELSDTMLMQCYDRQARVQELREELQSISYAKERESPVESDRSEDARSNVIVMPSPVEERELRISG